MKKIFQIGSLACSLWIGTTLNTQAQYNQYAQYHHSPLLINPAMVASSNEQRAILHYRQENLTSGFIYTNPMISYLQPLYKGDKRYGGFGVGLMQDQTQIDGNNALRTLGFTGSYGHNFTAGKSNFALGLQLGYYNKNVTSDNFTSREEILSKTNTDQLLTASQTKGFFTGSLGGMWYMENSRGQAGKYLSASAYHLNTPKYNFLNIGEQDKMPVNYVFAAGWDLVDKEKFGLQANTRFIYSRKSQQLNIGALGKYYLNEKSHLGVGAWWSTRAIVVGAEYAVGKFFAGLSYDLPTQDLTRGSSPEIVLGFRKVLGGKKAEEKKEEIVEVKETKETITSETATERYTIEVTKDAKGNELKRDTIRTESLLTEETKTSRDATNVYMIKETKDKNGNVIKTDTLSTTARDDDGDGVANAQDRCPNEAGVASNNGCPEKISEANLAEIQKQLSADAHALLFESGKPAIKTEALPYLDKIAEVMNRYPKNTFLIEGHTDNVGYPANNLALSQQRAESVKTYLVGKGINATRLTTKGFGDKDPIASNADEAGRTRNRRIEVTVQK